jgi:hypothetical protein
MILDENEEFPEPKLGKPSQSNKSSEMNNLMLLEQQDSLIVKKISQNKDKLVKTDKNVNSKMLQKKHLSENKTKEYKEFPEYADNHENQESKQVNKSNLDNGNISAKVNQDKRDTKVDEADVNFGLGNQIKSNESIVIAAVQSNSSAAQQADQLLNVSNHANQSAGSANSADLGAEQKAPVAREAANLTVAVANDTNVVVEGIDPIDKFVPGLDSAEEAKGYITNKTAGWCQTC